MVRPQGPAVLPEPGRLLLRWSRPSATPLRPEDEIRSEFLLPELTVRTPALTVAIQAPPFVALGASFLLSVTIANRSAQVQSMMLSVVDNTDKCFLFSGLRTASVQILPSDSFRAVFTVVPLSSGQLRLPRIELSPAREVYIEPFDTGFVLVHPSGASPATAEPAGRRRT
eukprot:c39512_g1_i1.p1 GENE.c39512_g1_i1~~c39512_g1_i1.p1  ORF type:complete len:170 (+),score=14.20 c39512_g1_i1:1-510(+)